MSRRLPSLAFWPRMASLTRRAAQLAKKGVYTNDEWIASSCETRYALERSGCVFQIENLDVLKNRDGPCVIIGNHMSTLETFILPGYVQPVRSVTFVVKEALTKMPVFKHIMNTRNPIVVGRVNPRDDLKAVLEDGADRLKKGISVVVFPQRTRTPVFNPEEFNTIGVKLAKKAGVPVVPLALKTDAWANGKFVKDIGRIHPDRTVHFCFGEPMEITGNGREQHEKIVGFIMGKLTEWGGEVR